MLYATCLTTSFLVEFWKIRSLIESTARGGRGLFNSARVDCIPESRDDQYVLYLKDFLDINI